MQLKFFLWGLLLIPFLSNTISAQSSTSLKSEDLKFQNPESFTFGHDEWAFYLDKENKVYYIDFETINVNLNDIKVYNEQGEVVISDNLWNLPVNTIYELNFNDLAPGNYKIELRSYTGLIQKDIMVSE